MLIPVIPPFRQRRGRAKRRPQPPAPVGLSITSVEAQSVAQQLIVRFSGPITWDGSTVPSEFKAYTSDEFFDSPINVISAGADWIELEFNGAVAVGAAWEVVGPLAGISPAVAFPQAGMVS